MLFAQYGVYSEEQECSGFSRGNLTRLRSSSYWPKKSCMGGTKSKAPLVLTTLELAALAR